MAKVLLSIQDRFLEQVDSIVETEGRTRSELIRQALREYLDKHHGVEIRRDRAARQIEMILLGE